VKDEQKDRERPVAPRDTKRPYTPPRLTEYGSIAKLTQGTGSTQADAGGGFKMTCL
jgi:hypothetical protein